MFRANRAVIVLLLFISTLCFGVLGCSYGPALVWLIVGDPENSFGDQDAKWYQLPPSPLAVQEIVAVDYFTVYVRTREGRILGCYRESRLDTRCWFELDQIPEVEGDWQMNGRFPEPPNGLVVVQEYQIDYLEGRDSRSVFSYILDENGRVWQWGFEKFLYFGGPNVIRISFIARLGGLLSGILLPFLIFFLIWIDESRSLPRKTRYFKK